MTFAGKVTLAYTFEVVDDTGFITKTVSQNISFPVEEQACGRVMAMLLDGRRAFELENGLSVSPPPFMPQDATLLNPEIKE